MPDFPGTNASETLNGSDTADTVTALGGSDKVERLGRRRYGLRRRRHRYAARRRRQRHPLRPQRRRSRSQLGQHHRDAAGQCRPAARSPVTGAPGDDGFVYALRKDTGDVIRINTTTGAQSTFLDIPDNQFSTESERGVLNVAFHPDYESNGRFFVYPDQSEPAISSCANMRARATRRWQPRRPSRPSSPFRIANFANHNGGSLAFGPDGNLYIGVGDGGSATIPTAMPRTSMSCSARSCGSTSTATISRAMPRATTRSPTAIRLPARRPGPTRSGPPGCAIRGASASIPSPAISTSPTSDKARARK